MCCFSGTYNLLSRVVVEAERPQRLGGVQLLAVVVALQQLHQNLRRVLVDNLQSKHIFEAPHDTGFCV